VTSSFRGLSSIAATILLVASIPSFYAQSSASLVGPSLGFVWNEADSTLRPLQGVLGNATVGIPANVGINLSHAIALDGLHFLASSSDRSTLLFVNLETAPASVASILGVPPEPKMVSGSRRGGAAALYYPSSQRVLIVGGFPSRPALMNTLELPFSDAVPSHMAVADDGSSLVYAVPGSERDSLYVWSASSGSRLLTLANSITAVALAPNGDVLVADSASNEVFALIDPFGAAARHLLADSVSGVSKPVGLAVSESNRIYVSNSASSTVLTLDSDGVVLGVHPCSCQVSGLYPIRPAVYRLSEGADRTVYLFEARPAAERVVFVPVSRSSE